MKRGGGGREREMGETERDRKTDRESERIREIKWKKKIEIRSLGYRERVKYVQ